MENAQSFERTFPRYPFAALVRASIALGRLIGRWREPPHDGQSLDRRMAGTAA
jgi:hypothetical protein